MGKIHTMKDSTMMNDNKSITTHEIRFKYDPESDKMIRIQKDLAHNEDLKRLTFDSEAFQQEVNKEFGKKFEQEIVNQMDIDFYEIGGIPKSKTDIPESRKNIIKAPMLLTQNEYLFKDVVFQKISSE